jgi:Family of unknown function (DUF5947)
VTGDVREGDRGVVPPGQHGLRRFVRPPAAADQPAAPAQRTAAVLPGELPAALASRLSASAAQAAAAEAERCEFCGAEVAAEHGHVADLQGASLICSCRACYLLFTQQNAGRGRYKTVPDRYCYEPGGGLTAAEWDELQIPVGLAFFLRSAASGQVTGFYPSPAGATECQLDLQAWQRLAAEHPMLTAAEPDVEAVLLSKTGDGVECFLVPIDVCYELAGRMRLHWRGFDGGEEARASIAAFLASVRSRARAFGER